jgi:hypothetical protein
MFLKARTTLAFQLAGRRPSPERLRIAAERIDRFLIETIQNLALFEASASARNIDAYRAAQAHVKSRTRKSRTRK